MAENFGCPIDHVWRVGDKLYQLKDHPAKFHNDAGFSISFPEQDSWQEAEPIIRSFLTDFSQHLREFRQLKVKAEFSIGLTVGGSDSFIGFIELSPKFISELHKFSVSLSVNAYPTNES